MVPRFAVEVARSVRASIPPLREGRVAILAAALAAAALVRVVLAQLATLPLPLHLYEGHNWRQAFTYGVAWNFAHTGLDVLHPQMLAETAPGSHVIPMEAPLYPLLASFFLRVSDSTAGPRILGWLGLVATAVVLCRWLADPATRRGALADRAGLLAALALSPMIAVEFRSLQPEPFAAGLAIMAAFHLARHGDAARQGDVVKGAVYLALSLLAKPYAIAIVPALVLFAAWGRERWLRRALVAAGAISLALVPWLAWDRWAHRLLETELHGNWIIEIGHPPGQLAASLLSGQYAREVLLHHLPGYASSWWLFPATLTGIYRGLAESRLRRHAVPLLVWIAGYAVLMLAVGIRLNSNRYYYILAAAPLAWFTALGLGATVRAVDAWDRRPAIAVFRAGFATLLLLPIGWAASKASLWEITTDVGQLGLEKNHAVWTTDLGLLRLVLVLLPVFAVAPLLRPKRIPQAAGAAVVLGLAVLALRPARDVGQYLRFYVAADRREGFDAEVERLRAAVAGASRVDQQILLSPGGTYREPLLVYYFYALRNGVPYRAAFHGTELADLRARGARLYLQVDQTPEPVKHVPLAGRVLAKGAWWRLSCMAEDDCEKK